MFLTAARLFDGRGDSIVDDPLIGVADGRIVTVTQLLAASDRADILDLGDVTLLPGLIDIHQHLAFDASTDPVAHLADVDDATRWWRHGGSSIETSGRVLLAASFVSSQSHIRCSVR